MVLFLPSRASRRFRKTILKGKWLYLGAAGFLGILCAFETEVSALLVFLCFGLLLLKYKGFTARQIGIIIVIFLLFFLKGEIEEYTNRSVLSGKEKMFSLMVMDTVRINGNSFTSFAQDEKTGEKIALQYTIPTLKEKEFLQKLPIGAVCKFNGNLEQPDLPRNLRAFDYREYLRNKEIFWILKVDQLNECKKTDGLVTKIKNIRKQGIDHIGTYFPKESASLAAALIFGERTTMEPDLIHAYQRLGIVHLLAISGLNVTMLVGIFYFIGLRFGITREKMTNLLLALLPIYMILAGSSPSVNRACIMMFLVLCLTKWNQSKKLLPIDIVSIVFIFYIFIQPYIIYDVGFQLSFSVTFSLVLSTRMIAPYVSKPIYLLLGTSFISQLASAPILLYHFYEFSIVSLFINIPFVPLFSMIILPVMLFVFILHLFIGNFLSPLLSFLEFLIVRLNEITKYLSLFPLSTLTLGRPTLFFLLLYLMGIPYFFHKWEMTKSIRRRFLYVFIPVGIMLLQYGYGLFNLEGEVTMIDVGQGDSILIRLPMGKGTYLIDTGGTIEFQTEEWKKRQDPFEVGKDILVPYLKSKGVTEIDKLILTHGDADHIGGALFLLSSIRVNENVLTKVLEPSNLEQAIMRITRDKNIPIHYVQEEDYWSVGKFTFKILAPISGTSKEMGNNHSIVLYTELGGLRWLFTGDMEAEGEERLISKMKGLKVDVLKVGHHGSNSSTTELFLNEIKPKVALISAGEDNRFGHPHPDVVKRLEEYHIKIFRTDLNGEISFRFHGERGTFFAQFHTIYQK